MSLEQQTLIQQLIVPALLGALGGFLILTAPEGDDWEPPFFWPSFLRFVPGGLLCGLGLFVADYWKRGLLTTPRSWLTWSSNNQWEWLVFLVPVTILASCVLRSLLTRPSTWARVAFPVGLTMGLFALHTSLFDLVREVSFDSVREELWRPVFVSFAVGAIAMTINMASFDEMAASGTSRWCGLILVGQLGCIATLGIQSYMSLAQWTLSLLGVVLGATICSCFRLSRSESFAGWNLSVLYLPVIAATIPTFFATQRFSSEKLPLWLLGSILFLPTIVWAVDILYTRSCRTWARVLWAFLICAGVLAIIIVWTKPFESEW
jgi:hypothetical protein